MINFYANNSDWCDTNHDDFQFQFKLVWIIHTALQQEQAPTHRLGFFNVSLNGYSTVRVLSLINIQTVNDILIQDRIRFVRSANQSNSKVASNGPF
jgi:hypothetical protein